MSKAVALLKAHAADLPGFFATTPKAASCPAISRSRQASGGRRERHAREELASLCANIEHIKEIVATQQSYARVAGVVESIRRPNWWKTPCA